MGQHQLVVLTLVKGYMYVVSLEKNDPSEVLV